MKMLLKTVVGLGVVYIVGFLALIYLIGGGSVPEYERHRISSPNGRMDAVVVIKGGTLILPIITQVYIVSKGEEFDDGELLFRSTYLSNGLINWDGDNVILIEHDAARDPTNNHDVEVAGHRVRLVLNPRPTPCNLREESCPWHEKHYPFCGQNDQTQDEFPCYEHKTGREIRSRSEL
ncbi:MAG: hypothetical protein HQL51_07915 [Magnetococcales bacterium]|nr:hypothetical protein [Magnetococcales bacterium]